MYNMQERFPISYKDWLLSSFFKDPVRVRSSFKNASLSKFAIRPTLHLV